MHGPCDGTVLHWCPKYDREIQVVDDVAKTILTWPRRLIWRRARDRALARWAEAGIGFTVKEGRGVRYKGLWSQDPADSYIHLLIPGTIRLVRTAKSPSGSFGGYKDFARYDHGQDAAIASYGPQPVWWKEFYFPTVAAMVGHEIGHCLGLCHRSDGGIMAGANKPDAHDLASIRGYYLD